jgi:hypothetical protein
MTTERAPNEVPAEPPTAVDPVAPASASAAAASEAPASLASEAPASVTTGPLIVHPTPRAPLIPSTRRTLIRAILTLVLFTASVALGATLHVGAKPPEQQIDRFPTIAGGAAEPAIAADIARAIMAKDPQALARTYTADMLQAYQEAMSPVVEADDIRYVGGVEREGETLASYVVTGQTAEGMSLISGFVVHVKDSQITGFN